MPSAPSEQYQELGKTSKQDCLSPKLMFLQGGALPTLHTHPPAGNRSFSPQFPGASNGKAKLL